MPRAPELRDAGAVLGGLPPIPLATFQPVPARFIQANDVALIEHEPRLGDPITIGIDLAGALPTVPAEVFDILLTAAANAPAPWVSCFDVDQDVAMLAAAIEARPIASATVAGVLRSGTSLGFEEALWLESLAYSTLLAGEEFRQWRSTTPLRGGTPAAEPVRLHRDGDSLLIRLDDPASRNAISPAMRDALVEALTLPDVDPTVRHVSIVGAGPVFSSGGHLDDFGTSRDLAQAHLIRTGRSPAAMVHRLADRITVRVHAAAIGSGLEFAAAASRLEARSGAVFRLPEVAMGLIPGAGGTASIPRRIGRHRTTFMALTGQTINAATALDWGLIDVVTGVS